MTFSPPRDLDVLALGNDGPRPSLRSHLIYLGILGPLLCISTVAVMIALYPSLLATYSEAIRGWHLALVIVSALICLLIADSISLDHYSYSPLLSRLLTYLGIVGITACMGLCVGGLITPGVTQRFVVGAGDRGSILAGNRLVLLFCLLMLGMALLLCSSWFHWRTLARMLAAAQPSASTDEDRSQVRDTLALWRRRGRWWPIGVRVWGALGCASCALILLCAFPPGWRLTAWALASTALAAIGVFTPLFRHKLDPHSLQANSAG